MMLRFAMMLLLLTACGCGSGGGADVPAADAGTEAGAEATVIDGSGTYYVKEAVGDGCEQMQVSPIVKVVQAEGKLVLSSEEPQWEETYIPRMYATLDVDFTSFNGPFVLFGKSEGELTCFYTIYVDTALAIWCYTYTFDSPFDNESPPPSTECHAVYGASVMGNLHVEEYPAFGVLERPPTEAEPSPMRVPEESDR